MSAMSHCTSSQCRCHRKPQRNDFIILWILIGRSNSGKSCHRNGSSSYHSAKIFIICFTMFFNCFFYFRTSLYRFYIFFAHVCCFI